MINKIKVLAVSALVLTGQILVVKPVLAQDTCVSVYGGGVVCGIAYPKHEPVKTGLVENLGFLGFGFLASSGVFALISKKIEKSSSDSLV